MKLTIKEASNLGILSDVLKVKKYDPINFMERSSEDTEIELSLEDFKYVMSVNDIFEETSCKSSY